jgi:hypothetical protein
VKLAKSTKKQIDVVLVIINQQDCSEARHALNVIMKHFATAGHTPFAVPEEVYLHPGGAPMG